MMALAVLAVSCSKNEMTWEQNPYRKVIEYTPDTFTMEAPGNVTADATYDWITMSQSGNSVSFTVRRNTTGLIRRAEYTITGQTQKMIIFQKAHSLDATLSASVFDQSLGAATIAVDFWTGYSDDYVSWGLIYGKTPDMASGKDAPQGAITNLGKLLADIEDLEEDTDYYIWAYAVSTEGDKVFSNMIAMIPPVYVQPGEDLQAAIDNAKEYSEIRLPGGVTFSGGINIFDNNKNKTITGGWNEDYSAQSTDNLTVIDGGDSTCGIFCAADDSDLPLNGYVELSYLDISGCKGDHGSAVHICGGPLTLHHSYIHDNHFLSKGAVGTREEDYSSDMTIYNCIFEDNFCDDGHGACLGIGDGVSEDDPVHATVVNNLFINNRSDTFGGYASIFICYSGSELIFVNNTVVGNFNYYDGDYPYEGMKFRGNTRDLLANNIIVGNIISEDDLMPAVEQPHPNYIGLGGAHAVLAGNIIEGEITEADNMTESGNQYIAVGKDSWKSVLDSDYKPVGIALGAGTLDSFTIQFENGWATNVSVQDILDKYPTDLAGNSRVVNGKVDAGCYQAQ